jgi:hypothetical protein
VTDEHAVIEELTGRLAAKFPAVGPDTIAGIVRDQHARFDGSPVRDFVPLFVERNAAQLLSATTV